VREGVADGFSKCARWEMPLGGLQTTTSPIPTAGGAPRNAYEETRDTAPSGSHSRDSAVPISQKVAFAPEASDGGGAPIPTNCYNSPVPPVTP
jgi:hypothetical protein